MQDPYNLARFIAAQSGIYQRAFSELRQGAKRTHWMWFVFPQLTGLGRSPTAVHFAISGPGEALAYLQHPALGRRLLDCTDTVNALAGNLSASAIFASPDDLKFRSSMTLFAAVAPEPAPFEAALGRYFDGKPDARTLGLLES